MSNLDSDTVANATITIPAEVSWYVDLLHERGKLAGVPGIFTVTGRSDDGWEAETHHFTLGEQAAMAAKIAELSLVYDVGVPPCLMSPDLPDFRSGKFEEVVATLGFLLDNDGYDGDDQPKALFEAPMTPTLTWRSSPDSKHLVYILDYPILDRNEAKQIGNALAEITGDTGAGRINIGRRVPGTLNHKRDTKFTVTLEQHSAFTNLRSLRALVAPHIKPLPEKKVVAPVEPPSEIEIAELERAIGFAVETDPEWFHDRDNRRNTVWGIKRAGFGHRGFEAAKLFCSLTPNKKREDRLERYWFDEGADEGDVKIASFWKQANSIGFKQSPAELGEWKRKDAKNAMKGLALVPAVAAVEAPLAPAAPEHKFPEGARGPQTAEEMEPIEMEPDGGVLQSVGERIKNFVLPDYLWDGILLKRFCYSLTAQTGTGKTAIAMMLAVHVALGQKFCDRDVAKGQVIYLAGENPTDVDMRWIGMCKEMGLDPDTLEIAVLPFAGPLSKYADVIRKECTTRNLTPALIIVDTAAAYNESESEDANQESGDYARKLRELTTLPGQPCVLILAHPTKNAKAIEEMIPRGGSAFVNEMDGNLGAARPDKGGPIAVKPVHKFRGTEFDPLHFATHVVKDVPLLTDAKGKQRPTVIARYVSEKGVAAMAKESKNFDVRLMRDIEDHPDDDQRKRATRLVCAHTTIGRRIEKLAEAPRKLVDNSGLVPKLTSKGEKELNRLEMLEKAVHQDAPSMSPIPVPSRG